MKYSELELKKMIKRGIDSIEDEIKFNILNFISTIHHNKQDFIESSYNSEYFGDLGMTFKKKPGQIFGVINVNEQISYLKHLENTKFL